MGLSRPTGPSRSACGSNGCRRSERDHRSRDPASLRRSKRPCRRGTARRRRSIGADRVLELDPLLRCLALQLAQFLTRDLLARETAPALSRCIGLRKAADGGRPQPGAREINVAHAAPHLSLLRPRPPQSCLRPRRVAAAWRGPSLSVGTPSPPTARSAVGPRPRRLPRVVDRGAQLVHALELRVASVDDAGLHPLAVRHLSISLRFSGPEIRSKPKPSTLGCRTARSPAASRRRSRWRGSSWSRRFLSSLVMMPIAPLRQLEVLRCVE